MEYLAFISLNKFLFGSPIILHGFEREREKEKKTIKNYSWIDS